MLSIKTKSGWRHWWLGNAVPEECDNERVITFQADGDELNLILNAMEATGHPLRGSHIYYTKPEGFRVK
jgi:hypothetical protein